MATGNRKWREALELDLVSGGVQLHTQRDLPNCWWVAGVNAVGNAPGGSEYLSSLIRPAGPGFSEVTLFQPVWDDARQATDFERRSILVRDPIGGPTEHLTGTGSREALILQKAAALMTAPPDADMRPIPDNPYTAEASLYSDTRMASAGHTNDALRMLGVTDATMAYTTDRDPKTGLPVSTPALLAAAEAAGAPGNGTLLGLGTPRELPPGSPLLPGHAYSVTGFVPADGARDGAVLLQNPHGGEPIAVASDHAPFTFYRADLVPALDRSLGERLDALRIPNDSAEGETSLARATADATRDAESFLGLPMGTGEGRDRRLAHDLGTWAARSDNDSAAAEDPSGVARIASATESREIAELLGPASALPNDSAAAEDPYGVVLLDRNRTALEELRASDPNTQEIARLDAEVAANHAGPTNDERVEGEYIRLENEGTPYVVTDDMRRAAENDVLSAGEAEREAAATPAPAVDDAGGWE